MVIAKTLGLFFVTAVAEILGCYLPYLWLKKNGPMWLLIPAAVSLALFVWLLTLHPTDAVSALRRKGPRFLRTIPPVPVRTAAV